MNGLGFQDLIGYLRAVMAGFSDRRKGLNRSYRMEDFGLSAFAVCFTTSTTVCCGPPCPHAKPSSKMCAL